MRPALLLALLALVSRPSASQAIEEFDIASVLQEISAEVAKAAEVDPEGPPLTIDSVDLELKVVQTKKADGSLGAELKVYGLEVGGTGSVASQRTRTLKFTFKPDTAVQVAAHEDLGLVQALKTAKTAIAAADPGDFTTTSFKYETNFGLVKEGGLKFKVLGIGAGGGYAKETVHTIRVNFARPEE